MNARLDLNAGYAPLILSNQEEINWDDTFDVVVVGFGGAGACAALEAHERGCRVLLIDRYGGGGATAYSGGVIYAGGTDIQHQAGFDDNADEMYAYLSLEAAAVSKKTIRKFCEESAADIEWLMGHGVQFDGSAILEKTAYPPDGKFLYFSGNEKFAGYRERAKPYPRGHRTVGNGFTGAMYFGALRMAVAQANITIRLHTPATRLILDAEHKVVGIEVKPVHPNYVDAHQKAFDAVHPHIPKPGTVTAQAMSQAREIEAKGDRVLRIRARYGVILSAGGFVSDRARVGHHRPIMGQYYDAQMRLGSLGCDGSGISIGQGAGGATECMDSLFIGRLIAPPAALVKGIIVNSGGHRFINEECYTGFLGDAIARQEGGTAWLILDSAAYWQVVRQCVFGKASLRKLFLIPTLINLLFGGTKKASSVNALATKIGVPTSVLEAEISRYNADIKAGTSDAFEKSNDNRISLASSPFRAINVSIWNKFSFGQLFTLGGLVVDEDTGGVKRQDGTIIEGLYAAGRTAVGLCSMGYISGMSLADGVFSGRRAARSAAAKSDS